MFLSTSLSARKQADRQGVIDITVYIIKNTVTKRCYVGSSCDYQRRIRNHFSCLKNGKHNELMQEDYDKYGPDSFTVTVFGNGYGRQEGRQKEAFLMQLLRTQEKEFGYNYKDNVGKSEGGIRSRWRVPPRLWNMKEEDQNYYMYLWSLPWGVREHMTKKKYLRMKRKEEKERLRATS